MNRRLELELEPCGSDPLEGTHFTGRVKPYNEREGEDRRSLALEFDDEAGRSFTLYVEQHEGITNLWIGPASRAPEGDWIDLWAPPGGES